MKKYLSIMLAAALLVNVSAKAQEKPADPTPENIIMIDADQQPVEGQVIDLSKPESEKKADKVTQESEKRLDAIEKKKEAQLSPEIQAILKERDERKAHRAEMNRQKGIKNELLRELNDAIAKKNDRVVILAKHYAKTGSSAVTVLTEVASAALLINSARTGSTWVKLAKLGAGLAVGASAVDNYRLTTQRNEQKNAFYDAVWVSGKENIEKLRQKIFASNGLYFENMKANLLADGDLTEEEALAEINELKRAMDDKVPY